MIGLFLIFFAFSFGAGVLTGIKLEARRHGAN